MTTSSETALTGAEIIDTPTLNKGTAFTEEERRRLGLQGLLPPHVETLDEQVVRAYEAYGRQPDDLARHVYLRDLQDTNEVLFYRLAPRPRRRDAADRLHARPSARAVRSSATSTRIRAACSSRIRTATTSSRRCATGRTPRST